METVGSCATLVFREIDQGFNFPPLFLSVFTLRITFFCRAGATLESKGVKLDKDTAKLLLSPVLIDTINLVEKFGKTTPLDQQVAAQLSSLILEDTKENAQQFQDNFFQPIQAAKFDISSLSSYDLFRKDYKEVSVGEAKPTKIGVSSVTMSLADMVAKDSNFVQSMKDYCQELQLEVFVLMTMYEPNDPHR